ncbi:MAG: homoserine dehydrogenase [Chitinispirillaceae bacterium]|nr:homoserine dehydrogenase [Chitinispirillaceae bacterium]
MKEIAIGIVGAGTVGGGVIKMLRQRLDGIKKELGLPVRLARIADKDASRLSVLPVGDAVCSADPQDIVNDDAIQIVIELVGGTAFAKDLVLSALERGKHVITANKALLAEHGPQIFETAAKKGVSVYFEAAVGGGMPVIKTIREGLVGNEIFSVTTIINGTCNYILSRMCAEGVAFANALKDAQKKGYAETDPTLDVSGVDTGHKVAILASLVSGGYVPFLSISIEGITGIGKEDIGFARELGYTIKLLGIIKKNTPAGDIDVRVHPAMLHDSHILASVSNAYNAVLIEGDAVGRILLYGKGAGEMPTASAVVSDIVDVARNILGSTPVRIPTQHYSSSRSVTVKPVDTVISRFYLHFTVIDRPGVLASITGYLGQEGISLASVMQKEGFPERGVPIVILTHESAEKNLRAALANIEKMEYIKHRTQVIRIED